MALSLNVIYAYTSEKFLYCLGIAQQQAPLKRIPVTFVIGRESTVQETTSDSVSLTWPLLFKKVSWVSETTCSHLRML